MTAKLPRHKQKRIVGLRKQGFSISEIALHVGNSKSTVSRYVQNVVIGRDEKDILVSKRGGSAARAAQRQSEAYSMAKKKVNVITLRDQLLIAAALYWGEGAKREFSLANTDARLIKTFLSCLEELGLNKSRLKISLRLYEDINVKKARQYWASVIEVNPRVIKSIDIIKGKKIGKLPYGMCRIRLVQGNDFFNLLMSTIRLIANDLAPIAQRTEQWTPKP